MDGEGWGSHRRVVALLGCKGGVGATTLAFNLATAAAMRGRVTLLASTDLRRPQLGLLLGDAHLLAPPRDGASLDRTWLLSAIRGGPAGLNLAPRLSITPELVGSQLRTLFDVTVLDLAWSREQWPLLGVADRIVIVTTPMRPALRAARILLDELASRGHAERTICVLNHAEASRDVDADEVSALLGSGISHVPYDPAVVARSVNQGVAFVEREPDSSAARAVCSLAATLGVAGSLQVADSVDDNVEPGAGSDSARIGSDRPRLDRRLLRFGRR